MTGKSLALRAAGALAVLIALVLGVTYWIGAGGPGNRWEDRDPTPLPLATATVAARASAQRDAANSLGAVTDKQILFGDLHVHTTFSLDAFAMALPIAGGSGARPVADACDFARYCSSLDFWSVNDHALGITPWKWQQTVDAIRACDAVATGTEDVTPFLGWEWTQTGDVPEEHYGHKNVVLRGLEASEIPDRPIAAKVSRPLAEAGGRRLSSGILGLVHPRQDVFDLLATFDETSRFSDCPPDVPVREQAPGCRDAVPTPAGLYARLDDWGFDSIVIPHGTSWGLYTPPGSTWDKQLRGSMHDPKRQTLVEVYSGHGNSEEYRDWRAVEIAEDGALSCPERSPGYLPGCWRAGEIIAERCLAAGESDAECERRAAVARQHSVEARLPGHRVIEDSVEADWVDAGQCTDCFLPAFRYRPGGSAQYMLALRDFADPANPRRFEFGLIASSDNHSARPGTGYKEYARTEMTETRLVRFDQVLAGDAERPSELATHSRPYVAKSGGIDAADADAERAASFFQTGGLVAVHSQGRGRDAVWEALSRKEVYGTSGPRILLWFDLLNPPGSRGATVSMGGEATMAAPPIFQVRAAGSREQRPGCSPESTAALGPERLAHLCGGECHNPSDERRPITRIEVVRIRPQNTPDEPVAPLIEDPWRVHECVPDPDGCTLTFTDPDFVASGRDALYYVRAVEAPSLAVGADPLGCTRDENGRCIRVDACGDRPDSDDCLATTQERAWSSPIFVAHEGARGS